MQSKYNKLNLYLQIHIILSFQQSSPCDYFIEVLYIFKNKVKIEYVIINTFL